MRIAHIGLASYYTDGMTYQDNQLAEQNVRDGNETLYISNAAKYVDGEIVVTGYEDIVLESGVRLIRLPYVRVINSFVSGKVRMVRGLYQILDNFKPDVILSHDLTYYSVLDVVKYKKNHKDVKLYADTHTDSKNSGRNWLSIHVLHRFFYKSLIKKTLKYLDKYLYIGIEEKRFSIENYRIPEEIMTFFPLGTQILDKQEYELKREKKRQELSLQEGELLFIHSGKLDGLKRTENLVNAFCQVPDLKAKLVIIGSIPEERNTLLLDLFAKDSRIEFLGWKSGDELKEYLCACDLYCQPGGPSASLQNAIGCNCPVMCYPHEVYLVLDKGNIIWVKSEQDMVNVFESIVVGNIDLSMMAKEAQRCALECLDYREIVKVIYQ